MVKLNIRDNCCVCFTKMEHHVKTVIYLCKSFELYVHKPKNPNFQLDKDIQSNFPDFNILCHFR